MTEHLFVRVDATPQTGLGHFMRCLALAEAWLDAGGRATFVGHHEASCGQRLARERIERIELPRGLSADEDLERTLAAIVPGSAIVLDGYAFDTEYQRKLAERGRLLVIDDTGDLPAYAGDLLLNQNPHAQSIVYDNAPAERLLGTRYALLEREYASASMRAPATGPAAGCVVTLGGTDADNAGGRICGALEATGLELHLVVGPLNPHAGSLEREAARRWALELIHSPPSMLDVFAKADLAVSAAGSTALQLACLGVPSVLVALADNQEPIGAALDAAGAAVYLGRWPQTGIAAVASAVEALAGNPARRNALAGAGRRLVDGRGARRVCKALAGESG